MAYLASWVMCIACCWTASAQGEQPKLVDRTLRSAADSKWQLMQYQEAFDLYQVVTFSEMERAKRKGRPYAAELLDRTVECGLLAGRETELAALLDSARAWGHATDNHNEAWPTEPGTVRHRFERNPVVSSSGRPCVSSDGGILCRASRGRVGVREGASGVASVWMGGRDGNMDKWSYAEFPARRGTDPLDSWSNFATDLRPLGKMAIGCVTMVDLGLKWQGS